MPTKLLPETELRRHIEKAMLGLWTMTWHENLQVNPGVPDLSYVMNGAEHETGWLELKAVRSLGNADRVQFTVEASQHQWIKNHCERVPVHFLLDWDTAWYLLDGSYHWKLADPIARQDLEHLSVAHGNREKLRIGLNSHLRRLTGRHVARIR